MAPWLCDATRYQRPSVAVERCAAVYPCPVISFSCARARCLEPAPTSHVGTTPGAGHASRKPPFYHGEHASSTGKLPCITPIPGRPLDVTPATQPGLSRHNDSCFGILADPPPVRPPWRAITPDRGTEASTAHTPRPIPASRSPRTPRSPLADTAPNHRSPARPASMSLRPRPPVGSALTRPCRRSQRRLSA